MTPLEKFALVLGALVVVCGVVGFLFYWLVGSRRDPEPWVDDWQVEPESEADAEQLIADLTYDLPGLAPQAGHQAGELHPSNERTITGSLWDQWWQNLDGLDRGLLVAQVWRERQEQIAKDSRAEQEQLWAELVAETRELCGVAA